MDAPGAGVVGDGAKAGGGAAAAEASRAHPATVIGYITKVLRDPPLVGLLAAGPLVAGAGVLLGVPLAPAGLAPWLFILALPLAEELTFRGLLQGQLLRLAALRQGWLGISGANAITTLLFALAHLPLRGPLTAALVLLPSLTFGWVRDRHAAVWPAVLLHASYNASAWLAPAVLR